MSSRDLVESKTAVRGVRGPIPAHTMPDDTMADASRDFKGNKLALPSKRCAACNRPMTWRKKWARTWAEVKFCSAACRRLKQKGRTPGVV